jgi:hypothetical protein
LECCGVINPCRIVPFAKLRSDSGHNEPTTSGMAPKTNS